MNSEMKEDLPTQSCTRIDLNFCDFLGDPIEGLVYRIRLKTEDGSNGEVLAQGASNAEGQIKTIEDAPFGATTVVEVQNDAGQFKAVGEIALDATQVSVAAVSGQVKVELPPTQTHTGVAGAVLQEVVKVVKDPEVTTQAPDSKTQDKAITNAAAMPSTKHPRNKKQDVSRNVGVSGKPVIKQGRDKQGQPVAVVEKKTGDWYEQAKENVRSGIHWLWSLADFKPASAAPQPTTPSLYLKNPPQAKETLKRLIDVATENTTIEITDNAATVLSKMVNGQFDRSKYSDKQKAISKGQCARYVNIALAQAGVNHGVMNLPSGSVAGPQLEAMGFSNVTAQLPDPRWAATGDVVVYRWTDAVWEKRKVKYSNPHLPNHGHIDIRSDEGYISDFIPMLRPQNKPPTPWHPTWADYEVVGIYRKVFDPLPTLRISAFLRCIREFECQGEHDDAKRYGLLNTALPDGSRSVGNFSIHPWKSVHESLRPRSTAAGAYQITLTTWTGILYGNGPGDPQCITPIQGQSLFDNKMQDRIAVALLERRGALPLLRQGKLEDAVAKLLTEWTSLPGAKENAHRKTASNKPMDMAYLQDLFANYLNEEMKKAGL